MTFNLTLIEAAWRT